MTDQRFIKITLSEDQTLELLLKDKTLIKVGNSFVEIKLPKK